MNFRQWLISLHRNRRGTSMTEFIISLPVFLIVFAGLLKLGEFSHETVRAGEEAKLETFRKFLRVQQGTSSDFGDMIDNVTQEGEGSHLNPVPAGASAGDQIRNHEPRLPTDAGRAVLTSYEATSYGRLSQRGSFGESTARLRPTEFTSEMGPMGVQDLLNTPERSLFGDNANGQVLAFDLVSDRMTTPPQGGDCSSLLDILSDEVNSLLNSSGARPMLAAGIRYGTVTGEIDKTVTIAGEDNVEIETYYNTLVAPHIFDDDPHRQASLATYISRLALKTCSRAPYNQMLGISRGRSRDTLGFSVGQSNRRLPSVSDGFELHVPDPHPAGDYESADFQPPFVYYGGGMDVDYGN